MLNKTLYVNKPECTSHNILNDATRRRTHGSGKYGDADSAGGHTKSPDWQGQGWYRIMEPAGTIITEQDPGKRHCGTTESGFIADGRGHPSQVGETVDRKICYNSPDAACDEPKTIQITHCGLFYVYELTYEQWNNRMCTE